MSKIKYLAGTILVTFIILFITSFLLDIYIIEISVTRTFLIFCLMVIEAAFGVLLFIEFKK